MKIACLLLLIGFSLADHPETEPKFIQGLGVLSEGVAEDIKGNLYVSGKGTGNAGVVGKVDFATGTSTVFFTGAPGSEFGDIRFHADGTSVYMPDNKANKVIKVDIATSQATDFCDLKSINGLTNVHHIALARNGNVYCSTKINNAGAVVLCKPDANPEVMTNVRITAGSKIIGIALSTDDKTLYMTYNKDVSNQIWKSQINTDGTITAPEVHTDLAQAAAANNVIDATKESGGMRTDTAGNVWVTRLGMERLLKIGPDGNVLKPPASKDQLYPVNIDFGGRDGRTIWIIGYCGNDQNAIETNCLKSFTPSALVNAPGRQFQWFTEINGVPPTVFAPPSAFTPPSVGAPSVGKPPSVGAPSAAKPPSAGAPSAAKPPSAGTPPSAAKPPSAVKAPSVGTPPSVVKGPSVVPAPPVVNPPAIDPSGGVSNQFPPTPVLFPTPQLGVNKGARVSSFSSLASLVSASLAMLLCI